MRTRTRTIRYFFLLAISIFLPHRISFAQTVPTDACPRPVVGNAITEPEDLRSKSGILEVNLAFHSSTSADGHTRYCYVYKDGVEAPSLRLRPGDTLILNLTNNVEAQSRNRQLPGSMQMDMKTSDFCSTGQMTASATNLHFHGLDIPPVCHQDDVLKTIVAPGGNSFQYRFQVPLDASPGLYWYHPHIHGFSSKQVMGGASGALIVEGIEQKNRQLAGLPERVLVIRDQDLVHPEAEPVGGSSAQHAVILTDAEGDTLNTGMDGGKPAKDLSLNFVPVPYPDYAPAVMKVKPDETQFWRVLNASAITYLDLEVRVGNVPQLLGVAALDGAPFDGASENGQKLVWKSHIAMPPAGRAEFIFKAPAAGVPASFVTRVVDTGPAGENDPTRALANIVATPDAPELQSKLPPYTATISPPALRSLRDLKPVRVRKFYLSEEQQDPADPNSPTMFYITVDGQKPKQFDPNSSIPNITAHQGDVEDWIVENRSQELHAFHIHQIHFMVMEWNGVPMDEPFLRDTVNVAYWDGKSPVYPSVRLRLDFRSPNTVGLFPYHCHLLEHEDGGMMGTIRVVPTQAHQTRESR